MSDSLIEQTVNEFFVECFEDGYDLEEVENIILESIELTESILIEENVTYGHDTQVKQNRLQKVKNAIKGAGKLVARGAGYVAGATVRGVKAVGREIRAGYARGRSGSTSQSTGTSSTSRPVSTSQTSGSSSTPSSSTSTAPTSSSSPTSSGSSTSTSSSTPASSGSSSSKPGFFSRIGSALKSGLKRVIAGGARKVARGAIGIARRMEKQKPHPAHSRIGSLPPKAPPSGAGQRDTFVPQPKRPTSTTTPSAAAAPSSSSQTTSSTSTSGPRPIPRSSRTSSQSSSTRQTTSSTPSTPPKSQAPVGSAENPRIGQPAKETKPSPTPAATTSPKPTGGKGRNKPQTSTSTPTAATPTTGRKKKAEQTPVANPPQAQTGTAKVTGKGKRKGKKNSEENQNPKIGNAPDLDTLLKMEQLSLDERRLSSAESRKKEHIVKSMKSRRSDFERRYPGRGEEVMFATATKMAKKIAEQLTTNNKMNQQNSTQQTQQKPKNSSTLTRIFKARNEVDRSQQILGRILRSAASQGVNIDSTTTG